MWCLIFPWPLSRVKQDNFLCGPPILQLNWVKGTQLTLLFKKGQEFFINIWANIWWYQISGYILYYKDKIYIKNTWFALSQTSERVLSHNSSRREMSQYIFIISLLGSNFLNLAFLKHNLKVWGDVFPFPNTWHFNY